VIGDRYPYMFLFFRHSIGSELYKDYVFDDRKTGCWTAGKRGFPKDLKNMVFLRNQEEWHKR